MNAVVDIRLLHQFLKLKGIRSVKRTATFYPRVQGVIAIANPNNSSVFQTNHQG